MKLSYAERWILINQYRILKLVTGEENPRYDEAITILGNGYEEYYGRAEAEVSESPFPQDIADEVHDILQMFCELQWVKAQIEDSELLKSPRYQFWGFDANNNHEHLAYARFLHRMNEYAEVGERLEYNSHSDTIATYFAMVRVWRSIKPGGIHLTTDDVRRIIEADIS